MTHEKGRTISRGFICPRQPARIASRPSRALEAAARLGRNFVLVDPLPDSPTRFHGGIRRWAIDAHRGRAKSVHSAEGRNGCHAPWSRPRRECYRHSGQKSPATSQSIFRCPLFSPTLAVDAFIPGWRPHAKSISRSFLCRDTGTNSSSAVGQRSGLTR